ncbi:MAG: TRAP transporter small permease [Burkholderiaceae bacterium]
MRDVLARLGPVCSLFGAMGAAVALLVALLMVISVLMRAFIDQPISGDVEITQMGIALGISLCLPYAQFQKANIIVDFFTQRASSNTIRTLDSFGQLLLALVYALLAWRTSVGAIAVREAGETTMIISLPMWLAYASLAPGLALAAIIAILQGLTNLVSDNTPELQQ